MTMPSEPSPGPVGERNPALAAKHALTPASAPDRRLHPMSWLFVLLMTLRQFAVPLVVVLVLGRRGNEGAVPWEIIGALGALVLAANAVLQYFTYRFRIEHDGLRIRSGLLQRTFRDVPFRRIHNVTLHRNVLHRFFGVAEVRLESAGGVKPEAEMRVLRLADAQALESLVRQTHAQPSAAGGEAPATAPPSVSGAENGETLLRLPTSELIRLGLISNRGMIVVGAAFGLMMQSGGNMVFNLTEAVTDWLMTRVGLSEIEAVGTLALVMGGGVLLALIVLLLRLLSIALSMLQFHGFTLSELDGRIQVEAGLLTRVRGNTPLRRIQAFSLSETLLHRWFGRQSLRVDTAVIESQNNPRSLRDLVPVSPPSTIDALLARLFPQLGWPALPWQPLHPRAWRRMLLPSLWLLLLGTAAATLNFGLPALWALALTPLLVWRARGLARRAAYAVDGHTVAVRHGWLNRRWRFAEIAKLQAVELRQTPFDRRHGMATLWFDTAGANPMEPSLAARYLPEADARRLAGEIGARIAASRLHW